jgi:hypothetical protein
MSGQLTPRRFIPDETAPGTLCIKFWLISEACLNIMENNPLPKKKKNTDLSAIQPASSRSRLSAVRDTSFERTGSGGECLSKQ